jgi:cyclopropane-fatty-acyl-phospholipid synthase
MEKAMRAKPDSLAVESSQVFQELFKNYSGPNFAVKLWDETSWRFSNREEPACTIVFRTPAALRSLVLNPTEVALGEAYIHNEIDVEGDLFSVFAVIEQVLRHPPAAHHGLLQELAKTSSKIHQWLRESGSHTPERDRAAIAYHYDQPVEFYRPWLGETLAYSCAYFRSGNESLDEAQRNKLDLICKKLRLRPSEHFLDIGCGWGSLILHATLHHGAYAYGITLSQTQAETAAQRIRDANVTQSCRAELKDYRALEAPVPYDKIASVGMFEHVGRVNLARYFQIAYGLLKPGGVFLNTGITTSALSPQVKPSFIDRYVFPDGELVTIHETIAAAEAAGFEVRDLENLREHYEKTLRFWVNNLERSREQALQHVSESTYRIWRLYMAGCAAAFQRGDIAIFQVLLSRPENGKTGLPLTREDWYVDRRGFPVQ